MSYAEITTEGDVLSVHRAPGGFRWVGLGVLVYGAATSALAWYITDPTPHRFAPALRVIGPLALILGAYLLVFARRIARRQSYEFDRGARVVRRGDGKTMLFSAISHLGVGEDNVHVGVLLVPRRGDAWPIYGFPVREEGSRLRAAFKRDEIARFTGLPTG